MIALSVIAGLCDSPAAMFDVDPGSWIMVANRRRIKLLLPSSFIAVVYVSQAAGFVFRVLYWKSILKSMRHIIEAYMI